MHRLDGLLDEDGEYTGEVDAELQSSWLSATSADPAAALASALDLRDWMASLPEEDQKLIAARFTGYTLAEMASETNRSVSAVFARLKKLGTKLAVQAGVTIKKKNNKAPVAVMRSMTPCAA